MPTVKRNPLFIAISAIAAMLLIVSTSVLANPIADRDDLVNNFFSRESQKDIFINHETIHFTLTHEKNGDAKLFVQIEYLFENRGGERLVSMDFPIHALQEALDAFLVQGDGVGEGMQLEAQAGQQLKRIALVACEGSDFDAYAHGAPVWKPAEPEAVVSRSRLTHLKEYSSALLHWDRWEHAFQQAAATMRGARLLDVFSTSGDGVGMRFQFPGLKWMGLAMFEGDDRDALFKPRMRKDTVALPLGLALRNSYEELLWFRWNQTFQPGLSKLRVFYRQMIDNQGSTPVAFTYILSTASTWGDGRIGHLSIRLQEKGSALPRSLAFNIPPTAIDRQQRVTTWEIDNFEGKAPSPQAPRDPQADFSFTFPSKRVK